jgi:transcriptional regulatory protein LevR
VEDEGRVNSTNVFAQRLDLLEASGQVTTDARRLTDEVVAEIEREFAVQLDEETGAQLVTHLAMALSRVDRGDPQASALAVVTDELAECPQEHEFSRRVLGRCGEQLGRDVPEGEIAYLAVHLCVLSA